MSTRADDRTHRAGRSGTALRLLGAAALGVSAYVHLRIALERPPLYAAGQVTVSGLFLLQGLAALAVVVWVLVRGDRLAWLGFGAVALVSLVALVLGSYVQLPAVGPIPAVYDPDWYPDKYLAAASAAVAVAVAVVALLRIRGHRGGAG